MELIVAAAAVVAYDEVVVVEVEAEKCVRDS